MALVAGQIPLSGYQIPDYSGAAQAGKAYGAASTGPYNMISSIAQTAGDYFKQQGEKKKLVKQSSLQIDAALQLFPDLAPSLQSVKERMRDENIPLADRAAEAEVVANLINMGVGEMRNRSNMSFKQEQAMADAIYKEQRLGMEERRTRATEFSAMQGAKPTFDLKEATITSPDGQTFKKDIPYDKNKGMFFDPDAGKYIKDINKWGFGEPAYAEDMPPTSQVGGAINESALPAPLRKYASSFQEQGDKYGVDPALLAAISMHETANGKSSAFRNKNNAMGVSNASGPIQMGSVEASIEKMASLLGKGINQGKGPYANAKSIADIAKRYAPIGAGNDPRGLNKYWTSGVSANYEKLSTKGQEDNSTSMIGDLSKQAMGTPEQQAEIARMIEQGAGMATSQVAPSGAMPTEPRMDQPQPTPQASQYKVRPGFVPVGGGQQKQKTVKVVSGEEAQRFGLKPEGTYELSFNPDGSFAGVQTVSQPPTETEKIKVEEAKAAKEKAKASKDVAIKTISEFVDNKGEATEALKSAVGYGEAFATGVAEYAPIIGTQSGKTRSDQQRLNRLIEGSILDAASLLKPVSNTDLLMLIKNRPKTTDPEETWTTYLREIRSILADPDNYIDSGTANTQTQPQTATQKLRGKLK